MLFVLAAFSDIIHAAYGSVNLFLCFLIKVKAFDAFEMIPDPNKLFNYAS